MLLPKITANDDGKVHVTAINPNPAVSTELLIEISGWMQSGATIEDVIDRLRTRTVPNGYSYRTWIPGKTETRADKVRSIISQLMFSHDIKVWDDNKNVPFRTHMYVPEKHPITNQTFHEREDEGHVFKRIGNQTRMGGPNQFQLEAIVEAAKCEQTMLTYSALTGRRKQSIADVERLFNPHLAKYLQEKGYIYEAKYIRTIMNWRRATDERGLSQSTRSKYNQDFIELVLDELMPWHTEILDYSTFEVNRELHGVCGFSRETLIAVTTDIESREQKAISNMEEGQLPEHPRSSTTDDVECFFSVLRDLVGKHFTVKQVQYEWRKLCLEYTKRMDPDLPFYYHTSHHDRFFEGPRPNFDVPNKSSTRNPRQKKVPRRDRLGLVVSGRATMPTLGALSTRMKYHNVPIELPPPPNTDVHIAIVDHSY